MVTSRTSPSATAVAVAPGPVINVRSPAAVSPSAPRFTAWAGPPAAVGRWAAYDFTNPVHPQTSAAVTESPMATTVADPGAMVGVGVAAEMGVATAFGTEVWGNPPVGAWATASRMAQIATADRKAPAASQAGPGRRRRWLREFIGRTIRPQPWGMSAVLYGCRWR